MAEEKLIVVEEDATNAVGFRIDDIDDLTYEERQSGGLGTIQILNLELGGGERISFRGAEAVTVYATIKDSFSEGGVDASPAPIETTQASILTQMELIDDMRDALSSVAGGVFMRIGTDGVPLKVTITGIDHGGLSGLSDDDHAQYALLAGRGGGQTLIGGTVAGEDLTLQSTAHATKGSVFFGAAQASAYDEVNDRFGMGTTTPNAPLEVKGDLPGIVGGFYSGHLHVTGAGTAQFSNAVITGHSAYDTNTQLWYLGSTSSSNNDIGFLNRQNAAIHFYTNEAFRMAIDNSGKVGIGVASPDGTLHVHTATAGGVTANAIANDLVVENSGNAGLSILSPDVSSSCLVFGSPTDNYGAHIIWNHDAGLMIVGTAKAGADLVIQAGDQTEAVRILGTGGVDVTGNITVSGTVDGIDIATDVAANTTHRSSDGTDHSYISQDVTTTASPTFAGLEIDLGLASGGIKVRANSNHLTLYENDAVDPADNWFWEVNGLVINLWFNDDSAGTYIRPFSMEPGGSFITYPAAGGHFRVNESGVDADFRVESANNQFMLFVDGGIDRVGIGASSPIGLAHIDQASTSAAIPVLVLDQADLSEEFIDFRSAIAAGNPIDTAAIGTYYGKVRVAVNSTFKYMALYNS